MGFLRLDGLRERFAVYKSPALVLSLMLVTVLGAFLGVRTARNVMLRTRAAIPAVVPRVAWLPASYLDRHAIAEQSIAPPELVRALLWPVLGSPALVEPAGRLDVILDRPYSGARLALVPREALAELDQHLYALPAMPNGDALMRARIATAQALGEKGSMDMVLVPQERKALGGLLADERYQSARLALLARVKRETDQDARAAVSRFRAGVARIVERDRTKLLPLATEGDCVQLGVGTTCVVSARVPVETSAGLYMLVLLGTDEKLLDFQMNAAYRPVDRDTAPSFVVAADMQWGDAPSVAGAALSFVSLINALERAGRAPDFILMAGDVVDGQFGSAGSVWSRLFGGAENYTRDFIQAWLALAALRVPIYLVPGNHDGYRLRTPSGNCARTVSFCSRAPSGRFTIVSIDRLGGLYC